MAEEKLCTPGVYIELGTTGFRIGESECMEIRVPQSAREYADCLGKVKKVLRIPVYDQDKRRSLQNELIDLLGSTNSCNKIRA